ncbi:MAG: hypothetical protein RLZZ628_110 [Bacteroidota bacterium]|jgi:hypothetical protein
MAIQNKSRPVIVLNELDACKSEISIQLESYQFRSFVDAVFIVLFTSGLYCKYTAIFMNDAHFFFKIAFFKGVKY